MNVGVIFARLSESFIINLELFGITLALGLPLGLIIAFGSMSKFGPLRYLTKIIVWIVRGIPLMLQVLIIYYVPAIIAMDNSLPVPWVGLQGRLIATGVAFIINYACYFSEIFRGGIESIHIGQNEAGQVLGMTRSQIFFKVTLLQVVKRTVPPMGNEIITLIKDTSLARVIANKEIIMMAQEYGASGLIWPLFSTALFFLVFVGIITLLLNWSERRLSYFR
jgi:polar amino acid transport system permease protein